MKRSLLVFAGLAFLFAPPVFAAPAGDLIRSGDALFAGRTVSTGAAEALTYYERAATDNPADPNAQWKTARALLWLGDHAKGSERKNFYQRGISAGERAIRLAPGSPDARFWLGALYGSYGEARGILKSIALIHPIHEQMEAINRIDARWGGGAGLRVLGIVDYKVPGFAGGSRKRALERLTRALKIDPSNPFNQYYMAEFLFEAGRKEEARAHLEEIRRAQPSLDVDAPDLGMTQERARALEKKLTS